MNNSIAQFDDLITSKSLLTHYFYKHMWNEGKLTKENLAVYAKEYFHLAKRIPAIVEKVRVRAVEARPQMLDQIDRNIVEETEHIDLWKRFAKSLGVTEDEIEDYVPTQTVRDAVDELEALADGTFEEGVAAMYALELDLPAIAQSKKDGLCDHYDLDSEDAHIYFDEHLEEEHHLQVWRQVPVDSAKVEPVVQKALAAQHKVLDGVCEACDICMTC